MYEVISLDERFYAEKVFLLSDLGLPAYFLLKLASDSFKIGHSTVLMALEWTEIFLKFFHETICEYFLSNIALGKK